LRSRAIGFFLCPGQRTNAQAANLGKSNCSHWLSVCGALFCLIGRFRPALVELVSQSVFGTANTTGATVQNERIDHRHATALPPILTAGAIGIK